MMSVPWASGVAGESDRRQLLNERFRVYTRVALVTFVALAMLISAFQLFYPELLPRRSPLLMLFGLAGTVPMLAAWLYVRGRDRSVAALEVIDAVIALFMGLYLGGAAYLIPDRAPNIYLPFIFITLSVFCRVLVVPSRGARTLVMACLAVGPLFVAYCALAAFEPEHLDIPPLVFVFGAGALSAALVVLAWIGSDVMYGLRRQAREASRLGQYMLEEKLGEGAMGQVFRARHAFLRRPTAIKLLKAETASRGMARFEREVQLTSQLTHPNTIAIYDYGTTPDGRFYYAMEYLQGVDLERLVQERGPLSATRLIHVLEQIASALAEAHDRSLIHRDIKPANIMMCQRGDRRDVVKVVDFGLVKDLEQASDLTGSLVAGTPAFLAPEMITDPQAVGPASDLYALGATAYFLATGTLVFSGKTVAEVCLHHVQSTPPPLSERAPSPLPAGLEQLVMQCLEKRPADRPASARDMAKQLRRLAAEHPWTEDDAEAWWRDAHLSASHEPPNGASETARAFSPVSMTVELHGRSASADPL